MLKQAINGLYESFPYEAKIKYSGKFKPYRANVRLKENNIQFNLSKKWKKVSKEIKIGLIQELLLKILKKKLNPLKTNTQNIELYDIFIKKLHLGISKTDIDPILDEIFDKVNEKYFYGLIDKTNLVWADSVTKLGSYEYGTDTITISKILKDDDEALNYVMYHEMLHKKQKFYKKNSRSYHHTKEFRKKEKEFENSHIIEKRLNSIVRKGHMKRRFLGLF